MQPHSFMLTSVYSHVTLGHVTIPHLPYDSSSDDAAHSFRHVILNRVVYCSVDSWTAHDPVLPVYCSLSCAHVTHCS